ncbi:MAG: helix-turn-helix domain-containing protein [Lachnospiraceae bacterium]|nr:helix-turn-helix domain-containing protein [Lachnospiraceae bacterium]
METQNKGESLTLGEKIAQARKSAGLTQQQLAEKILVSRQAITKWESDKGMPDIENLRKLAGLLNVSIDYLLDDGKKLDFSVMREKIDLSRYYYDKKKANCPRLPQKTGRKDMVVAEKYPDARIWPLLAKQILTKAEKAIDWGLGLTGPFFGVPDFINSVKNVDKEFYLVNTDDRQFLVMVTDEFIESRQLFEKVSGNAFVIGDFKFTVCGKKTISFKAD